VRGDVVDRLRDGRGGRVAFVPHCLLNENVRFLGGATRSGAVEEVVEHFSGAGVGIVQMPCPEQLAWGGVLKRWMLACYGRRLLRWSPARRAFVFVVRRLTAVEYARLARRVASEIADYVDSGFEVVEVLGVGASPSCGVRSTVDLDHALAAMAGCPRASLTPAFVRTRVVSDNVVDGTGIFIAGLRRHLARRNLAVPFGEYDLMAELGTEAS
jgi:predicted secreted protein